MNKKENRERYLGIVSFIYPFGFYMPTQVPSPLITFVLCLYFGLAGCGLSRVNPMLYSDITSMFYISLYLNLTIACRLYLIILFKSILVLAVSLKINIFRKNFHALHYINIMQTMRIFQKDNSTPHRYRRDLPSW